MKEFYNKFLYIPKNGTGKVREKVMLVRITISIAIILVCLAAMSITAYAYFSAGVSSNYNVIKTAKWDIAVEAESDATLNEGYYMLDNSAGSSERIYEFTVSKAQDANATVGYTRIDVKNDTDGFVSVQTFYTQPIGEFLDENGNTVTDTDRIVKISVPVGRIYQVKFIAEWGSCAKEPIVEEGNGIELENLQVTKTETKDTNSSQESQTQTETQSTPQQSTDTSSVESTASSSSVESNTGNTESNTQANKTESEVVSSDQATTSTEEETE